MALRARRCFDANGNSLNDTFRTFTWDADGNPVTIGPVSLTFDALDRMVEQSVSGTNSEIVYSPAGVKLALMNGATLTKAFVPLTGGATAVYNASGLAYYRHTDHLGSSRFASTPTQTPYSDTAYSPFGEPYASSGAIDNSFTGQNQDTTAGLYDFLFREQDPNQTRWTSPDPAGLAAVDPTDPQSWNRYSYVLNNPLRAIDPFGLDCVFLNDSGDGVEEIAPELDAVGCGAQGGVYFAGTIDPNSIQFDPNSDFVFASGTPGNSQFSCGGANCDQGALDAFANSIFGQSSTSVSATPSSFLSFIFSSFEPIYVPNDVPLNQNARIILPQAAANAAPVGNPCVIAGFYLVSATGGTVTNGGVLTQAAEAATNYWPQAVSQGYNWLYRQTMTGAPVARFLLNAKQNYNRAKDAAVSACNAMQ